MTYHDARCPGAATTTQRSKATPVHAATDDWDESSVEAATGPSVRAVVASHTSEVPAGPSAVAERRPRSTAEPGWCIGRPCALVGRSIPW